MKANANIDINFETKLKLNITFRLATDAGMCVCTKSIDSMAMQFRILHRNHNILNV